MKYFPFLMFLLLGALPQNAVGQLSQWANTKQPVRQFAAAQFGADYAMVYGLEYGFKPISHRPIWVTAAWSTAFGGELFDDWNANLSAQCRLFKSGKFSATGAPALVVRRYRSDIATLMNIGAGATFNLAYNSRRWGIAMVGNYEHTLGTHLRHHHLAENYPGIYNGWISSSGGNFKFGVQTGYRFAHSAVALNLGKVYAANFKDNPTLPFYGTFAFIQFW